MISKANNPIIHFVIQYSALSKVIEKLVSPIIEKNHNYF